MMRTEGTGSPERQALPGHGMAWVYYQGTGVCNGRLKEDKASVRSNEIYEQLKTNLSRQKPIKAKSIIYATLITRA